MKRIMILLPALLLMAGSAGTVRAEIPGEGSLAAVQNVSRRISGKILDQTGAPVIGASVMVPGTLQGAVSDMDGNFSLDVEAGVSVLDVSCIGYAAYRLELGDGNVYEIVLRNNGNVPAIGIKLNVTDPSSGASVLPAYFSDGYFTLLPREKKAVRMELPDGISAELVSLYGYNVARKTFNVK